MNGKTVLKMHMVAEGVKNMGGVARGRYSGDRINVEELVLDLILSIDELVHESANLKMGDVKREKRGDKIVVDLQIAAEDIGCLTELSKEDIGGVEVT